MSKKPDLFEYDSIDDLEETIDWVYEKSDQLEENMAGLLDQIGAFLNYKHDNEEFRRRADYVMDNIPDEADPAIIKKHARENLDNPENAGNWDKLEEAEQKVEDLSERWRVAYTNLWNEFGYSGEQLQERIEDQPPVLAFLNQWERNPTEFFEEEEKYEGLGPATRFIWGIEAETHDATLQRHLDLTEDEMTKKQRYDSQREDTLERMLDQKGRERNWNREIFAEDDRFSNWVNESKLDSKKEKV